MTFWCWGFFVVLYVNILVVYTSRRNLEGYKLKYFRSNLKVSPKARYARIVSGYDRTFQSLKLRSNVQRTFDRISSVVNDNRNESVTTMGRAEPITKQPLQTGVSNGSGKASNENSKRQYIFGAPVFPSSLLVPRRDFGIYPRTNIHKGACLHHICYHGGVCVRTMHGFYCDCPEEYIGAHCEFKRKCLQNPCKNSGTCTELGQGDFTCTCTLGSKGKTCEMKDSCVPNPCDNDGQCTEMDDGYHCTCELGFKGDRCQMKALCFPNPCKNGGTCIDHDSREKQCSCALGDKGELCEITSECKADPCQNGGTCIEMAVGYKCACLKGFVGKNCEETLCKPNPCANDGTCKVHGDHYTCGCTKNYVGKHCEVLNPCINSPCLNGGECIVTQSSSGDANDGFSCKCLRGYYGNMCQMK